MASLAAMDAAGTALRWARHLLAVRHAERRAFATLTQLLDRLDRLDAASEASPERVQVEPRALLAMAGFHLLASVGYALDLRACVVCGRACPDGAPAYIDGPRGGLVCRACGGGGGGGRLVDGPTRELAARAQLGEDEETEAAAPWLLVPDWLTRSQVDDLLAVLAGAMAAHAGLDASK